MIIDIIDYTAEQYAALTTVKLEEIRAAQRKKNALKKALDERLLAEKRKLVDRGTLPSTIWAQRRAELVAEYEADVEIVRDMLLFYLRYSANGEDNKAPVDVPYEVDYSLTEEERFAVVRDYYEGNYSDEEARFNAFVADEFAKSYLGELYSTLYYYFKDSADL